MSENKTFEEIFLSESKEENLKTKELDILLVTDLHMSVSYLEKLKEWQIENKAMFNYIFCTGDFLSLSYPENNDLDVIPKAEADISSLLSYLENMCLNVLYVGGNHDPITLFEDNLLCLTVRSKNLHKNFLKLANDLYVFGLGGSIPTLESNFKILDKEFIPYSDVSNKILWKGYPYNDSQEDPCYKRADETYRKDIENAYNIVMNEIKENNTTQNIKFILLTHNGPFYSSTNIREFNNKCAYMGSLALHEFLKDKYDIFLNIHGHNHFPGMCYFDNKTIINAGSLKEGKFARLKLKRDYNDEWQINKMEFLSL